MHKGTHNIPYPTERRVAEGQKRQKIQDIVLTAVYVTASVGVAFAAPNMVQLVKYVEKYLGPNKNIDRRIYQALTRLRSKGLISTHNTLTKMGKTQAASLAQVERIAPKIPLRWDRKWRVVIFDVWEKRKFERNRLRGMLEHVGFIKLQASVWVYPYPCEELFVYLRTQLRLGRGIRYMVVQEIDDDRELRGSFNLPNS